MIYKRKWMIYFLRACMVVAKLCQILRDPLELGFISSKAKLQFVTCRWFCCPYIILKLLCSKDELKMIKETIKGYKKHYDATNSFFSCHASITCQIWNLNQVENNSSWGKLWIKNGMHFQRRERRIYAKVQTKFKRIFS